MSRFRVAVRVGAALLAIALVLVIGSAIAGLVSVRRSLPAASGEQWLAGLSAPVTVARDALGVPVIAGRTRVDVARATGFVHAQERFFQMDLQRRRAAGELAALIGPAALELDKSVRVHRFRARSARVVHAAASTERALLAAYAEGVNAGLAALGARPFEYLLLRLHPEAWRPEDSVLVLAAMFLQLQDERGEMEKRTGLMYDLLPGPLADFLTLPGSLWDTPIVGAPLSPPPVPGPEVLDLRVKASRDAFLRGRADAAAFAQPSGRAEDERIQRQEAPRAAAPDEALAAAVVKAFGRTDVGTEGFVGSNNWVVGGRRTTTGAGLLANDMHLGLSVPNIWYRASLDWNEAGARRVTGVTLPGVPAVIVGSNGDVAWGFTNTTADWSDLVVVEVDPTDPGRYLTPSGPQRFEVITERIPVKGGGPVAFEVRETLWGPIVGQDWRGHPLALRWVPHQPGGMNLRTFGLETARTLDEAMAAVRSAGIPAQNCVMTDARGGTAWTIAGRIPRRTGFDGRLPASWADGARRWDGWLSSEEYPVLVSPPWGFIVTANNRLVGGEWLRVLGDGGYDIGARARQIRDALSRVARATPRDMLQVQLDDRALFLDHWKALALATLNDQATENAPGRAAFRGLVERTWTGRASPESAGYRLVRAFRLRVAELAFGPLLAPMKRVDPAFPATLGRSFEGPLWQLVTARPEHLLDPSHADWNGLLLEAVDQTVSALTKNGERLDDQTWGAANTAVIQHPLGRALPGWAGRWLDMPRDPLPGDTHMPRVQAPGFGASERLAVSPGLEHEGLYHMPGGQSGHPFSRHYRDGHAAWTRGEPAPFLPGPAVETLVLRPPP